MTMGRSLLKSWIWEMSWQIWTKTTTMHQTKSGIPDPGQGDTGLAGHADLNPGLADLDPGLADLDPDIGDPQGGQQEAGLRQITAVLAKTFAATMPVGSARTGIDVISSM